jgi:hypothetical protein
MPVNLRNVMKSGIFVFAVFPFVILGGHRLVAQVFDVNQFKTTVYSQTNAAPPTAPDFPDSYFFGTYIDTDTNYSVTNVTVFLPNNNLFLLNQYSPTYFENGSPYYSNETNFDTDFPGGTYDYNYNYTDSASNIDNVDILFDLDTNDLDTATIPAFTPACWTAMQAVDPTRDFTLSWNSYTLTPGADYAETFLNISDHATGNGIIGPNGPPEITSTNIPAGTLQYGRVYDVSLYFSERQNPPDYGFGDAFITVGWDHLTQATLITLPFWLQIAPAGTNVMLTWPAYLTNYHLETTASLPATWSVVTNLPAINGTTNMLTLPAAGTSAFFRLAAAGY